MKKAATAPVRGRRTAAIVGVLATIALVLMSSLWGIIGIAYMGGLLEASGDAWWDAYDVATVFVGALRILLFLGAGIAFVAWQRNMTRNLTKLGAWSLDPGVGWTTWSWIVPFANLFYPCRSMLQIDSHSRPPEGRCSSGLIALWWTTWILGMIVTRFSAAMFRESELPTSWIAASTASVIGDACLVVAGVAAIRLLLRLTDNQEQSLRLREADAEPTGAAP